jgi:hypothetical protein
MHRGPEAHVLRDAGSDPPVEANARVREHPGANCIECRERGESHQERDGQHHHPVEDLQHAERCGEIEEIDRQAECRRGTEIAAGRRAVSPPVAPMSSAASSRMPRRLLRCD